MRTTMLAGLVDGIITEDSDVFLFGGEAVYRKFFEQTKEGNFVECYQTKEIKEHIGLDRSVCIEPLSKESNYKQAFINLAMLLGSDYTQGVKNIGVVLAMEILHEFGNLRNFKKWLDELQEGDTNEELVSSPLKKKLVYFQYITLFRIFSFFFQ